MRCSQFIVLSLFACLLLSNVVYGQDQNTLWYTKPAEKWTDALPIGNGRIGAMVFGTIATEHLQFNEQTLWTGGPRDPNHKGASKYLPQIRQLLADGKQSEAENLAAEHFMGIKTAAGDKEQWFKAMRALQGMVGNPALEKYDDRSWKEIAVPSYEGWEQVGLTDVDGAVWFRTTIDVPGNWLGKNLVLDLNRVRDQDFTYVNGVLIGNTDGTAARKYTIPAKLIKKGINTIAVQVLNYFDKGGIAGYKDTKRHIGVYPEGENINEGISLVKSWKYKIQDNEPPAVAQFQASYQPFGDLYLDFKLPKAVPLHYKRSLDLSTALARTSFELAGVNYVREYFASQPDQAIVIRLNADKKGRISFNARLISPHHYAVLKKIDPHTVALSFQVSNGVLKGESRLRVLVKSGTVQIKGTELSISNADEATLYLSAGTNFVNDHNVTAKPDVQCIKALAGLKSKSYQQVKAAHVKEYQQYYNRFAIDLGKGEHENLPTDERIALFSKSNDPSFAALFMQYGRYLLISSSRPGSVEPANLQGIWNDLLTPPWGSKYTTNINLQMNYWPSEVLNLSAMNGPLFHKIKALAVKGAVTAQEHYAAKGWVLHHNTDIWNATAPINASNHGIWVSGAGWLSQHLWEHYLFTKDQKFLAEEAYPVMKQSAEFFLDFLTKDAKTGWLISSPSNSPENGGLVAGPTMDHQIIRTLFRNCIAAGKALGTDAAFSQVLEDKIAQIAPNQIGKYGQLQEWLEDKDDTTNKHRHVSHLWGVHPGNDITWNTPELMKAARQSLIYRGDEGTGWSLAWKINFWARFKEGDHAMKMINMLISPAATGGGAYVNLFDAHPPFQIDGNFGAAAGIAEMLVQSHTGLIELLPALPSALPYGEVKGLCARGAFVLDFGWNNGKLQHLKVTSLAGGSCKLSYGNKTAVLETTKGATYTLDGDLK
ncbi:glycoside hydrolase N-terminal domain-containing protein [Pedobacter sp. MC2016-14]|uniref:glycoside hydrolase family 95 protein n=1 Tax=Pedobacter sp. MC2016-14 TaxID=2897327 RepID=UPI001E30DCC6|nr:glycoside hydrolase N-terminal domain-containing protein [Pedobacter sp. MC2016-14]MCD0489332.1 glycoside hydrolase N-terminal domain-containing protein [Pedobacter sp. MC2016-14]